MLQMLLTTN